MIITLSGSGKSDCNKRLVAVTRSISLPKYYFLLGCEELLVVSRFPPMVGSYLEVGNLLS